MTEKERALLLKYLYGNAAAAEMCEDIIYVAHLLDDLVDQDKPRSANEIISGFYRMLVGLQRNPFFVAHAERMVPAISLAFSNWLTATKFERESGACLDKLAVAFAIRSSYVNVLVMAGMIVGGDEYGMAQEAHLREFFHGEGLRAYRDRLRGERQLREGKQHV